MEQLHRHFFQLLRMQMGLSQDFPEVLSGEEWEALYDLAYCQSLTGICYLQRNDQPLDLPLQWAAEVESIRAQNQLMNQEAARLTKLFADEGYPTAILKGQANARLYPDPLLRVTGDIDIWVMGGRERIIALLTRMGLIDGFGKIPSEGKAMVSYHHIHMPANAQNVSVEIHFRPSSGNFNPFSNRRLQRWLEQEILSASMVDEGFCVPSVRFTLVMQLSHIQRHFLRSGIDLRRVCDYYWLLRYASADDRKTVAPLLTQFGLDHTAGALMWMLGETLLLDSGLMLCEPDSYRGEWMLHDILALGNSGREKGPFRRMMTGRVRSLRLMMCFDFWEMFWAELRYWWGLVKSVPLRIRYRTISLGDV